MTNEDGVLRSIAWRDFCPWVMLFRLYHVSLSLQLLALGFIGAWATAIGWRAADAIILSEGSRAQPSVRQFLDSVCYWPNSKLSLIPADASLVASSTAVPRDTGEGTLKAAVEQGTDSPVTDVAMAVPVAQVDGGALPAFWHSLRQTPVYSLVEPFRRLFDPATTWNQLLFYFIGGLWSLLVWSWLGGAISRAAVVRLGRDERIGLRDSLDFARRKLPSYLAAPLLPLSAMVAISIPIAILGLLMRVNLGVALAGLLWLPVVVAAFVITLFAIGVLFGWPLMWSAISAEGSDAFDAISRSYAYTFQRPLQYLAYASIAAVLGCVGWLVVGLFCGSVVQFAIWAVGMGTGTARLAAISAAASASDPSASSLVWFGTSLIEFFNRCVLGVQVGYAFSFLWSASAAIYLLLRRDADQTELDDVYIEEEDGVSYGLPPLKPDEAGVPGTDDLASAGMASTDGAESP